MRIGIGTCVTIGSQDPRSWPTSGPLSAYAIGDSNVAAYLGQDAIMDFITSTYAEVTVAFPSHTIEQQHNTWKSLMGTVPGTIKWAVIQVGLNDLNPVEPSAVPALARLQDLVDEVQLDAGPNGVVLVASLTPCRSFLLSYFGATQGAIAYQKWLDMNEGIAGLGSNPITNVDGRVTAHEALLNDGNGNLGTGYDVGDGLHTTNAARSINAQEWVNALGALGVTV